MTKQTMDIQQREEIKRWLERGDIKTIAKKHEVPVPTAYNYLNGKVNTLKVSFLSELIDTAMNNKRIITQKLTALNQ